MRLTPTTDHRFGGPGVRSSRWAGAPGTTSRTRNQNEGLNTVRTYSPKAGEIERAWYVIDATDVVLGWLATHAAALLRGKHKPTFAPHLDGGDFVIVINADKVALTSDKRDRK